ncbi:hypothetical protein [Enterococcus malodoratus]|uniref:hypothetical protein n=1 Tax=Enterococcus malodoratus TaxID=71451 RepID=UPI0039AF46F1
MIYIVYGAPCSGKTTYVQQHIKDNDIVWDWDAVEFSFNGLSYQEKNQNINRFMKRVRRLFIDECIINTSVSDKWIILTNLNQKLIDELDAVDEIKIYQMQTSKEECVSRLSATARKDKDELLQVIEDWFNKYDEWW